MKDRSVLRGSATVGLAAGAAGAVLGLGAHFARRVLTPSPPEHDVRVLRIDEGVRRQVWLHGPQTDLPGQYSFIFDHGRSHAKLGPVTEMADDSGTSDPTVAREIVGEDHGTLHVGARGRITGWWYADPVELGLDSECVRIPLPGGDSWAWRIGAAPEAQADPGHWAIHIHGRGALPEETLRGVPPCARIGTTSLVIAYRNDPGAPNGLRGRYGLGLAERLDVDAAIAWARGRGATRITLVAYSMGATAAILAAGQGPHRDVIDGVVLDSPALDWPGLLRQQARLARAPEWVATVGGVLLRCGFVRGAVPGHRGTDLHALTPAALARGIRVPVLIHASAGDTFVPWAGSLSFARILPDLVTIREGTGEHVKLWNTNPEAWERTTEGFLRGLCDPSRPSVP